MTKFPKDFLWGAASAAYQIEGYDLEDGGGASIWRTFSHTPGKVAYGDTGDIACDSYHRYAEDIALLKELGVGAYRFSTSWARVDPNADGNWNEQGIAYYDKVVDLCLASGITPYMTLYHWELPQAQEDRGGWQNKETAYAFARFTAMMAEHFRGRHCPILFTEPGTTLINRYIDFVSKVVSIKEIRGKTFVELNCSKHNLGEICELKKLPITVIPQGGQQQKILDGELVGYTCLEHDVVYRGFTGDLAVGDIIVFGNVGGYSLVSKPPFIRPNCQMVTESGLVIKRKETFDEVFGTYA